LIFFFFLCFAIFHVDYSKKLVETCFFFSLGPEFFVGPWVPFVPDPFPSQVFFTIFVWRVTKVDWLPPFRQTAVSLFVFVGDRGLLRLATELSPPPRHSLSVSPPPPPNYRFLAQFSFRLPPFPRHPPPPPPFLITNHPFYPLLLFSPTDFQPTPP